MKPNNVFFVSTLAVCVAFAVGMYVKGKSNVEDSSVLLANIEALTNSEGPCIVDINGYRSWALKGGLFQNKREFRDCCSEIREGYSPEGTCRTY